MMVRSATEPLSSPCSRDESTAAVTGFAEPVQAAPDLRHFGPARQA